MGCLPKSEELTRLEGAALDRATDSHYNMSYDELIISDRPFLYVPLNGTESTGAFFPANRSPSAVAMPNGNSATLFNGVDEYFEIPDTDSLSVNRTGVLTIEAWIRPSTLEFPDNEGSGYVYWLGKGSPGQHEYALRMYSFTNTENPPRPNRISGYAFNLVGGLGSGSYFQDAVLINQWIHIVLVINTINTSVNYPTGYVDIYKDAVLRDRTALDQFNVVPQNGTAPLRIGTRSMASYFQGAIGKVAFYDYELNQTQVQSHFSEM